MCGRSEKRSEVGDFSEITVFAIVEDSMYDVYDRLGGVRFRRAISAISAIRACE